MNAIIQRFHTASGDTLGVIQLRCVNVLRTWIEKLWFDFSLDVESLLPIFTKFVDNVTAGDHRLSKPISSLLEKIESKQASGELLPPRVVAQVAAPSPVIPTSSSAGSMAFD